MIWNLGCGKTTHSLGFPDEEKVVNIDTRALPNVDEVCDVRTLDALVERYGAPDRIAAEDVLEHFPRAEAIEVLRYWCGLLKPGGELHVRTPDLATLAARFNSGAIDATNFERHLYGGQDYAENAHHCGFTAGSLAEALESYGMSVTRAEVDPGKYDAGNLWLWARKPLEGAKRFLIVTPWTAQGLTTMAVYFGRMLKSAGCSVAYSVWRHAGEHAPRFDPPGWLEDSSVRHEAFDDIDLSAFDVVVWLEVVEAEQVKKCNAAGVRTVWVPMWEFLGRQHPIDVWAEWSDVVCPTKCCYEAIRRLRPELNAVCVPWWSDYALRPPRTTPDAPVFLHIVRGLSDDVRNTAVVLEAWQKYLEAGGTGSLIVKTMRPLAKLVPGYEGPERCEVIERRLSLDEMDALYARADVFVYPSRREGLGMVLLEALSHGLPVVTTDAPPMNEWIRHGVNGLLVVSYKNPSNVPETLYSVSSDELAHALGDLTAAYIGRLKASVTDKFDRRKMAFDSFWRGFVDSIGVVSKPDAIAEPVRMASRANRRGQSVTILTVTCNRLELTKRTVESVRANTKAAYNWIFVDNGSTDGTVEWLRSEGFEVEAWPENRGKPAALNLLMQRVDTPWWVVLDNDVLVPEGWLRASVRLLGAFPDIGIVALSAEPVEYATVAANRDMAVQPKLVGAVNGACQVAKRELIDRIGYHSLAYGIGGYVDWEWCLRVRLSGLMQVYVPDMPLVHLGASCSSIVQDDRECAGRLWYYRSSAFVAGTLSLWISADGFDNGPQMCDVPVPTPTVAPAPVARKRSVVMVTEMFGSGKGGGTLSMLRLLEAVHDRDIDVTVLYRYCVGEWPKWIANAVEVTGKAPKNFGACLAGLSGKPDLVIADSAAVPGWIADTTVAMGVPMLTYVQFIRGLVDVPRGFAAADEVPVPVKYHDAEGIRAVGKSAAIVTNSEFTAQLVRELVGVEPVAIVQPPLEPSARTNGDAPAIRTRPYVLSCSVSRARGAGVFAELAQMRPGQKFLVLGGGGRESERKAVEQSDNLQICREWIEDMGDVYANTKVVFLASDTTETFGRVAAEALMNGIPVVASDVGHLHQMVTAEMGVLVPRGAGAETWDKALEKAARLRVVPSDRWNEDHCDRFVDVVESLMS